MQDNADVEKLMEESGSGVIKVREKVVPLKERIL